MLEAIQRSGYLLESRIVKMLDEAGYWVQPNVAVEDKITGKTREIDIIAEHPSWLNQKDSENLTTRMAIRTNFIIEIVNFIQPIVFFTPKTWSPNVDTFLGLKFINTGIADEDILRLEILERYKGLKNFESVHLQYCSFDRKANTQWMAYHPDDLNSSLQKMTRYISESLEEFVKLKQTSNDYVRLLFWQPIICTSGDIKVADSQGNLSDVTGVRFEYQCASIDAMDSGSLLVNIISQKNLLEFMNNVVQQDLAIASSLSG